MIVTRTHPDVPRVIVDQVTADDLRATILRLRRAEGELQIAAEGDSNDAEIDAGREVADLALDLADAIDSYLTD